MNFLLEVFLLLIPLVFGGVLHMVVVTLDLCKFIKIPINTAAFGKNKTYRGFVAMPLLTIPGVYTALWMERSFDLDIGLSIYNPIILAIALGIFYCLFELPNSYIKRRKGIEPGKMSKENILFHSVLDQVDSGFGLIIVYYFMTKASIIHLLSFLVMGTVIHLLLNYVLYLLKLRKEPM
ncbi:MAG: hypothetical protein BM556_02350 [Bacteriovorax sp. MedPE-SWde]|nr:MAG: hypothetical protein BM556_02350 [Bacteriovorax sp. MedPE-SWde]